MLNALTKQADSRAPQRTGEEWEAMARSPGNYIAIYLTKEVPVALGMLSVKQTLTSRLARIEDVVILESYRTEPAIGDNIVNTLVTEAEKRNVAFVLTNTSGRFRDEDERWKRAEFRSVQTNTYLRELQ